MTTEQLDEIEQMLAKFWSGSIPYSPAHGVEIADIALPLVKALREARARCETLRELADEKAYEAGLYARRMDEAQKARSEARTEVERLRKLLNPEPKPDIRETLMRLMREDQRKAIYAQAWEEALLAGNTREQAHSIARAAAEAALKEGEP